MVMRYAVAEMRATSEALALRQSESLAVLSQELFCSPDIIRQVSQTTTCMPSLRNHADNCCIFVQSKGASMLA